TTSWTTHGAVTTTLDAANFLDVDHEIYRLTSASSITAGYHDYKPQATVKPGGSGFNIYSSIQSAINSGANEVIIKTGSYAEDFYLVSGVNVVGAGADRTVVNWPAGSNATNALVSAEGIRGASLSRLSLVGDGAVTGVAADGQIQDSDLRRTVIESMSTGILIEDLNSEIAVVNNTIIGNQTGMEAVNCGSINARNNIIAYNTNTGLAYEGCAATQLHTYNDYWANGSDLNPNSPGSGELFLNPLFLDLAADDFRTESFSPVIDSGDPADATPPGSGGRVDIGHIEQYGASFFVDDDYCATCVNDGLLWQVDAFDSIQDAVEAAEAVQTSLTTSAVVPYTVGVAPGTYVERVVIKSPITVIGSGPEVTRLELVNVGQQNDGGAVVEFSGAAYAGIEGFTIFGRDTGGYSTGVLVTDAANNITIQRNLIIEHGSVLGEGVLFEERGSGEVLFNTMVNVGVGVQANDTWAVAMAKNNIIDNTFACFEANNLGVIVSDYNLVRNCSWSSHLRVDIGENDLIDVDPLYVDTTHYAIQEGSPAMDTAHPLAEVPLGGGITADRGYFEVTDESIAVSVLLGKLDESRVTTNVGVQSVEYGVVPVLDTSSSVTETLPSSWNTAVLATPNQSLTYWDGSHTPTSEGYYRIYSRATDLLDNSETEPLDWYDGAFIVDDTAPVVTWVAPADSSSHATGFLTLQAETADYTLDFFNVAEIAFEIDGTAYPATWSTTPWTADGSSPRSFLLYTDVISTGLAVGSHSAKAVVTDGAGNVGETALINFDVTGVGTADTITPTITITSHVSGDIINSVQTTIAGSGSDADSGIQGYYISFNAGISWQEMTNT
ncbi:MAG: hypothetical protein KDE48_20450, partial [Anaerolineales bacterium]|nr:hypothetical protein [Anaerolineales bacterium]